MKKLLNILMALALFGAAGGLYAQSIPQCRQINTGGDNTAPPPAQVELLSAKVSPASVQPCAATAKILFSPAPSSGSPDWFEYLTNLEATIETGAPPPDTNRLNNPAAVLFPSVLYPFDLMEGTNSLWMAQLPPTNSALLDQRGNVPLFPLDLSAPCGLRLANVIEIIGSSDFFNSLGYTQRLNGISYSPRAVGLIYSSDGTTNRLTSGPASRLVNRIIFTGIGSTYRADTQEDVDNINLYAADMTITAKCYILDDVGNIIATAVRSISTEELSPVAVHLLASTDEAGNIVVTVHGVGSASYTVKSSPGIMGPWTDYITAYNSNGGMFTFTVPPSKASQGYFK